MSNQSVNVSFKVSGAELSAYIDSIQKKSDKLTNDAIRGAIAQSDKSKEQLKIIEEQVRALEKKARLEKDVAGSIITDKYRSAAAANRADYDAQCNSVFADTSLSEAQKKERVNALTGAEAARDQTLKSEYRQSLLAVKEQERQSKIQTALSREQIQTAKEAARENVAAIKNGDKSLIDCYREVGNSPSEEERLTLSLIKEQLEIDKKAKEKDKITGGNWVGPATGVMVADLFGRMSGAGSQLANTKNGFDLISGATSGISEIVGGILGGVIGSFIEPGGGTVAGAVFGANIAKMFGKTFGEFEQRRSEAKEKFWESSFRYRAVTGRLPSEEMDDTTGIGVGVTDFIRTQSDYARRRGSANNSYQTALEALYADKGIGVDQSTSAGLIELQRSAKENNRDLAQLIGGVIKQGQGSYFKGNETTFLNEFLQKFTALQKDLLKTQTTVATGATFDILSRFNSLGVEFATSDPRSMGLISTINSSISNPNTDMKRALSFYALKKANLGMGLADLIEEQQKGLSSPTYLASLMDMVSGMGGDEDSMRLNFAGLLGLEGNQKFASDVFRGYKRGAFRGGISQSELSAQFNLNKIAEANTTLIERNTASVSNGLLEDRYNTVSALTDAFTSAFKTTMSGAVIEMANGKITFPSRGAVMIENKTKRPGDEHKVNLFPFVPEFLRW